MPLTNLSRPPEPTSGGFHGWLIDLVAKVNTFMNGALIDVTLTANDTTTTLTDARISVNSRLTWMPTTATAATAMTALYCSAITNGSATLTHDNTADIDRTFKVAVHG